MARHFRRATKGKMGVQHCGTVLSNAGAASAIASQVVLKTEAGARNVTGANQDITAERDTGNKCNVGDCIKYINLFMQVGPRMNETGVEDEDKTGWLEWAFVCVKESETTVPATTFGVQTLGVICTNMFRNECIYTGAIPVGNAQPNYLAVQLKVPKAKQFLRIGDEWRLVTQFRAVDSASTRSDAVRLLKSFMYKAYN